MTGDSESEPKNEGCYTQLWLEMGLLSLDDQGAFVGVVWLSEGGETRGTLRDVRAIWLSDIEANNRGMKKGLARIGDVGTP
jgi:hypothetical protein